MEEIEANAAVKVHRVTEDQEVKVEFLEEAGINSNEGMDEQGLREHEEVTKVKNVEMIELGRHRIETWYFSPFPPECFPDREQKNPIPILYLCEFTLRFFRHKKELRRHYAKNPIRHPPGNEIYRDPESRLAMFEIDGFEQKEYCQNLCWLAKLFLDHKTLFFDVDPFLFYVLCEYDERGYHIVGYYSKEKESESGYNLACILIIPAYQRKGYGKFLIEFSYALSKIECKVGSPEKPLSDLGQLGYNSFWSEVILRLLANKQESGGQLSIYQICAKTSFKPEDVISTLKRLKLLQYSNGQHVILYTDAARREHEKYERKRLRSKTRVKEHLIHWSPLELEHQRRDKNKIGRWHISSKISGNVGDDAGDRD